MIAVVGGGIAGAAVLHALVSAGIEAELYDEGDARSGGASAVPVALLNPFRGKRAVPAGEDLAGLERFLAVLGELDARSAGWNPVGVLRVADSAERAAAWRPLPFVRWVEPAEMQSVARCELAAPHGGFLFERGGFVVTRALRAALLANAVGRGGVVHERTRVFDVENISEPVGEGVLLRAACGERRVAAVVSCTGAACPPWAPTDDLRRVEGVVLEWQRSELGAEADPSVLEPVIIARCLLIRAADRVWVGGAHSGERGDEFDAVASLRETGGALWPALARAAPRSTFRAARVATPSNQPRVRRVAERIWAVEALAGRGYLRAFELADRVVSELRRELGIGRAR